MSGYGPLTISETKSLPDQCSSGGLQQINKSNTKLPNNFDLSSENPKVMSTLSLEKMQKPIRLEAYENLPSA